MYCAVMVKITAARAGKEDYAFYKALNKALRKQCDNESD